MSTTSDAVHLFEAARTGDRVALARSITLIESTRPSDRRIAEELIELARPHADDALCLGITGIPGVGKSTLIDALGSTAIEDGRRVAVLATDPSSTRTHGSILGDKTRMERLARSPHAFVRPTASGGHLGGVARNTRGALILCAGAGFDLVMIETVGVGQSELEVDDMADLNLLLMIPGAGDELQGIKRGIMESADLIVLTKADGPAANSHHSTRQTLKHAIAFLPQRDSGRHPDVVLTDALTGLGMAELWTTIKHLHQTDRASGLVAQRRREQRVRWMHQAIRAGLYERLTQVPEFQALMEQQESAVSQGDRSPFAAADRILDLLRKDA